MYGMVPYNLSPIQQGIQFGHSVVEYGQRVRYHESQGFEHPLIIDYNTWANEWKTFIILNGGTTNLNENKLGSLNQHLSTLLNMGVFCAPFYEPDLGDQLTAISFIIDERVFNREKYPDFIEPTLDDWIDKFDDTEDNIQRILALREFLHPKNFKLA